MFFRGLDTAWILLCQSLSSLALRVLSPAAARRDCLCHPRGSRTTGRPKRSLAGCRAFNPNGTPGYLQRARVPLRFASRRGFAQDVSRITHNPSPSKLESTRPAVPPLGRHAIHHSIDHGRSSIQHRHFDTYLTPQLWLLITIPTKLMRSASALQKHLSDNRSFDRVGDSRDIGLRQDLDFAHCCRLRRAIEGGKQLQRPKGPKLRV